MHNSRNNRIGRDHITGFQSMVFLLLECFEFFQIATISIIMRHLNCIRNDLTPTYITLCENRSETSCVIFSDILLIGKGNSTKNNN